jgi:hypothetical protein
MKVSAKVVQPGVLHTLSRRHWRGLLRKEWRTVVAKGLTIKGRTRICPHRGCSEIYELELGADDGVGALHQQP